VTRRALSIDMGPAWRALYVDRRARPGQLVDLVIDVRPDEARRANPYHDAAIALFADDLLEDLAMLRCGWPPGAVEICCVCWSGLRAAHCAFILAAHGWTAYWWPLSPTVQAMEGLNHAASR